MGLPWACIKWCFDRVSDDNRGQQKQAVTKRKISCGEAYASGTNKALGYRDNLEGHLVHAAAEDLL